MSKYLGYTILAVIIIACFAVLYILIGDIWKVLAFIVGAAIGIGFGRLVIWLIKGMIVHE